MSHVAPAACATHCPYCSLQCAIDLSKTPAGRWTVAGRDFPTNRGSLCVKGWTAAELIDSRERLRSPLVRDKRGGALREATWSEALDRIVTEVVRLQSLYGRDAVGA